MTKDLPTLRDTHADSESDHCSSSSIEKLFAALFPRACKVARRQLHKPLRTADEEDIALSAFAQMCARLSKRQLDPMQTPDQFWRVLRVIVSQKTIDYQRRAAAQIRGGGKVRGESAIDTPGDSGIRGLEQISDIRPDGACLVMLEEQKQHLLAELDNDTLRSIALWKMEDMSNEEIAKRLDVCVRTVERKVSIIRKRWWVELT